MEIPILSIQTCSRKVKEIESNNSTSGLTRQKISTPIPLFGIHDASCKIAYSLPQVLHLNFMIFLTPQKYEYFCLHQIRKVTRPGLSKKCIHTLTKKLLYAKLTYCDYPNKNFEHPDLSIIKI